LNIEALRAVLSYDPETGLFRWKTNRTRARVGAVVHGLNKSTGYKKVRLFRKPYYQHRLAWFYVYGEWPKDQIDHINGDKLDNRICNLREVSNAVNSQNTRAPRATNKVGHLGVSKHHGAYRARLALDGKQICVGGFKSPEAAHAAYVELKRKHHEGCTL
jgi:hypothetical protein